MQVRKFTMEEVMENAHTFFPESEKAIIQAWSNAGQTTTDFDICESTRLQLGCENGQIIRVKDWMDQQGIKDLRYFADYINGLDFNVEVVS